MEVRERIKNKPYRKLSTYSPAILAAREAEPAIENVQAQVNIPATFKYQ